MSVVTIYVHTHDTFAAVQKQVAGKNEQFVLLSVPLNAPAWLAEPLDLARLRHFSAESNTTIGLVTHNPWVWAAARSAGLRVFASQAWGTHALTAKRWWRQAPPRFAGSATMLSPSDRKSAQRRLVLRPRWWRWLRRYAVVLVFVALLTVTALAAIFVVPSATITIQPQVEIIEVREEIVVDPRLTTVESGGSSIPGRLLVVETKWQATTTTSGSTTVADAASRGTVVFANRLPEIVTIPAGTRVSTTSGERVLFQTTESAELPAAINSQVEIPIVAIEPGPQGNVEIGQINRVNGALATQVRVRNSDPLTGGSERVVSAVTQTDIDLLTSQLRDYLVELARTDMRAQLTSGEELVEDSVRIVQILDETASHFLGEETDRVSAETRAIIYGTAVNAASARDRLIASLEDATWRNFTLRTDSVTVHSGAILGIDNQGRVNMELVGSGQIVADLSLHEAKQAIRGQEIELAQAYLAQTLRVQAAPEISVWPAWNNRMPYLPVRIMTDVQVNGALESAELP
jgi:hypothetical protein